MDPADSLAKAQEVLSQSDVERLLAQVAEQTSSTVVLKSGGERSNRPVDAIQQYDFRQPAFLAAAQLRKLRLRHEEYVRSLAARLSLYLRMEFSLQMVKFQTLVYKKFIEGLPNPSHLTLFKAEPMRGICLLEIPLPLGVTIVDRLLGGQAHSVNLGRDLTEIEVALLDQVVQIVLGEWCNQWLGVCELRGALLGHESNSRYLETSPHDTVMLSVAIEASLGDCQDVIQLGFPYYTLEPLVRQVSQDLETSSRDPGPAASGAPQWNSQFDAVKIPLAASWNSLALTAREVSQLQVGDLLQLEPHCLNQVQVRLVNLPKFMGRLGTQGNRWAVELTQVLKRE